MAVLDRITVDPVRWPQVKRALLTGIAAVFFALGWTLFQAVRSVKVTLTAVLFGIGYCAAWCFAAVKVGWQAARGSA